MSTIFTLIVPCAVMAVLVYIVKLSICDLTLSYTRKLCYRKDDRAMRAI